MGGCFKNGIKRALWSSCFLNDTFAVPQSFGNSIMVWNFCFLMWESHSIMVLEKKSPSWHRFIPRKRSILVSMSSI
jgi:hypothetical protein